MGKQKPSHERISVGFVSNTHDIFLKGHLQSPQITRNIQNGHLNTLFDAKDVTTLNFQQDSDRLSENQSPPVIQNMNEQLDHTFHVYWICIFSNPCHIVQ